MTSIFSALQTTLSGMKVAQLGIGVISNNISNATNEDYTRKTLQTTSISSGQSAGGIAFSGYQRTVDEILNKTYNYSISDLGKLDTQQSYLQSVNDLYGISTDNASLSTMIGNFSNAWQIYSTAPESVANQTQVIATGKAVAQEIQRLSAGVEALDRRIQQDTSDSVDATNGLLNDIVELNKQISGAITAGNDVGSFQDQRDAKIRELSKYIKVNVYDAPNGTIRLTTAQGSTLIDINAVRLSYDGTNITNAGSGQVLNNALDGGKLQGLLQLREDNTPATVSDDVGTEVIRKLREQLDSVAQSFINTVGSPTTFAAAYNAATAATGEQTTSFFTGTDRFTIAVNSNLTSGATKIKQSSGASVYAALNDTSRSFSAGGVIVGSASYNGYVNQLFSSMGQASDQIANSQKIAASAKDAFKERVSGVSGVNTDEELVNLTQIQNSYAVSAHVVTIMNDMLDTLVNIVR